MALYGLDQLLPDHLTNLVFSGVVGRLHEFRFLEVEPREILTLADEFLSVPLLRKVLHVELKVVAWREVVHSLADFVQTFEFAADGEVATGVALLERNDAHRVSRDDDLASALVEEAEGEHTPDLREEVGEALLLLEVD